MKRYIKQVIFFTLPCIVFIIVLFFAVPKSRKSYYKEYIHKTELAENTPRPRMIFIGGSSVAFGMNSKAIMDSLHINVVNFGLSAGVGIHYPLEDCLQYIKEGDIVVLQMEYEYFFNGGYGAPESFLGFIIDIDWKNAGVMNTQQWGTIITAVSQISMRNLLRLIRFPVKEEEKSKYVCTKDGFNEYGDEVSHLSSDYVFVPEHSNKILRKTVDKKFMAWLSDMIHKYEEAGATIVLLPPVLIESYFQASYNKNIEDALNKIHHPYIAEPSYMVLNDSCIFDSKYHVNAEGVRQNTAHIINALKNNPQIFVSKCTDKKSAD